MIIAQISDTHLLDPESGSPESNRRIDDFRSTVAHVASLEPKPDMVVHTGDVSHNATPAEYGKTREIIEDLDIPFFPIVGNRDRRQPFLSEFGAFTGLSPDDPFVQYAVETSPVRIVVGDTLSLGGRVGDVCADRLDGLDRLLGAAPDQPTVLLLHHPPVDVPALRNPLQFASLASAVALRELIQCHSQIVRVLSGHTHRADTISLGPILLSTTPSIATELREDRYPDARSQSPIYQIHRIDAAGAFVSHSEIVNHRSVAARA